MNSQQKTNKKRKKREGRRNNKDVSAENKGVLNVHQIKVLEKIMQRKKDQETKNRDKSGPTCSFQSTVESTSGIVGKSKRNLRISKTQREANGDETKSIITKNSYNKYSPPSATSSRPNTRNKNKNIGNVVISNTIEEDNNRSDNRLQVHNTKPTNITSTKRTYNNRCKNQAEERIAKLRKSLETDTIDNRAHPNDHTEPVVNIQTRNKLKNFVIPRKQNDTNINKTDSTSNHQVLDLAREDVTSPKEKESLWVDLSSELENNTDNGTEIWENTATHTHSQRKSCNTNVGSNDGTHIWQKDIHPVKSWDEDSRCDGNWSKNISHSVTKCWNQNVSSVKTENNSQTCPPTEGNNRSVCLKRKRDSNTREWTEPAVVSPSTIEEKKLTTRKTNQAERRLRKLQTSLVAEKGSTVTESPGKSPKRLKNDNSLNDTSTFLNNVDEIIIDEDMEKGFENDSTLNQSENDNTLSSVCNEETAMDWETIQYELQEIKTILSSEGENDGKLIRTNCDQNRITNIVLDTNILLRHLHTISDIITGDNEHLQITVPWVVFNELDKLKTSHRSSHIDVFARKAIKFLYTNLTNRKLCGQSLSLANNHLYPCNGADDEILNCCLQLKQDSNVILLTDDINLCNKALVNSVTVSTHIKFVNVYWDELNIKRLNADACDRGETEKVENSPVIIPNKVVLLYQIIEKLIVEDLSIILKAEMMSKYDDLWTKIVLIQPPWSVKDLLKCFVKHWIAVFGDILPKDALKTITNIQPLVGDAVNMDCEKLEKICNYSKELFAHFLLTNHKYLATKCLESLEKFQYRINHFVEYKSKMCDTKTESTNTSNCLTVESNIDSSLNCHSSNVMNAFNCIVESLGKFCCSIADNLGIPHNLNISSDSLLPLSGLVAQADAVGNQLQILISCLSKLLTIKQDNITSELTQLELSELLSLLSDTLQGIGKSDITLNLNELNDAFVEKRGIFDEGCKSLLLLHNLLLECSAKYASMQRT